MDIACLCGGTHAWHTSILAAALGVAMLPGQAASQGTAPGKADAVLEEVIVSAQKREQNVQDLPASVQVLSTRSLQENNVTRLDDLQTIVPSVQTQSTFNTTAYSIRGVSSFASPIGAPSKVGIVIDDVPQSTRSTLASDLSDVQRIEVLGGPQSTISGRNATAGLINIVTRSPSSTWTANADVMQSSDHETQLKGFLAGPIAADTSFSLATFSSYFRGATHNSVLDVWPNRRVQGARGKLRWSPTDAVDVTLTGYYQRTESHGGGAVYYYADPGAINTSHVPPLPIRQLFTVGSDNRDYQEWRTSGSHIQEYGGIARVDYRLGDDTLSSITSIYRQRNNYTQDFATFDLAEFAFQVPGWDGFSHLRDRNRNLSQEFRLTSSSKRRLQYLVGLIYLSDDTSFYVERALFPVNWDRNFGNDNLSAYTHLSYAATERNTIAGGVRVQYNRQDYVWQFHAIPGVNDEVETRGDFSQTFATGDLTLQHTFNPSATLYLTVADGQQGKVYDAESNAQAVAGPLEALPPEKVRAYEVGFKSQWFDQRLTFDIAAFHARFTNFQQRSVVVTDNSNAAPIFKLDSVGLVTTRGIEVNASALLASLRLTFSGAYIDALLNRYDNAQCYPGQSAAQGCISTPSGSYQRLVDAPMPNSPKAKFNLGATYTFKFGAPVKLDIGALYRYQSKTLPSNGDPYPLATTPAVQIVNANVRLRGDDDRYGVELFVNNVFDKHYGSYSHQGGGFGVSGGDAVTIAVPRDWSRYAGLRLSARF